MVPRAIADVRRRYPNLLIDIDILKIEEAINYLLLGKGEVVAVSHKVEHPMLTFEPLAKGRLKCIVPEGHPLAKRDRVPAEQIVKYPLIGIDPNDPYGRILASVFSNHGLAYEITIRARFGSTVCALVTNGLGVAIIDEFTLAADNWSNLRALEIAEPTSFQTYIAYRKDATLSSYCEHFIASLRGHMEGRPETSSAQPVRRTSPRRVSQKVALGER
jgi:DNA-binding transcriptional LysR family regulator